MNSRIYPQALWDHFLNREELSAEFQRFLDCVRIRVRPLYDTTRVGRIFRMVGATGLEPASLGLKGRCLTD